MMRRTAERPVTVPAGTVGHRPQVPPVSLRGVTQGLAVQVGVALVLACGFLTVHSDPRGRVGGSVALAYLLEVVSAAIVCVAAREIGRGDPARATGLLRGWAAGAVAFVVLACALLLVAADWGGTCPCEPPIDVAQPW